MACRPIDGTFYQIRKAYHKHYKKFPRGITYIQARDQLVSELGFREARRLIEEQTNDHIAIDSMLDLIDKGNWHGH